MLRYFRTSPFWIRLLHREYWPMWVHYLPVYPYYLYLAARARSFFFFSATNPSIETGGLIGESKIDILDQIDAQYKPTSLLLPAHTSPATALQRIQAAHIDFPVIVKPNVGERGLLVQKVTTATQLTTLLHDVGDIDLIVQPFVDYPEELAVMYHRFPHQSRGHITSVTHKAFLTVTGDGQSTLQQLIWARPRAILQWADLQRRWQGHLQDVLPAGQRLQLSAIGNHSKGTKFLDANHLIDAQLEAVFDRIAAPMQGVFLGRFDLKCRSIDDLKAGRHIMILEFNGAGAEPAHIYDPKHSLWYCYGVLLRQWRLMFRVSRAVHRELGIPYMRLREVWRYWRKLRAYRSRVA